MKNFGVRAVTNFDPYKTPKWLKKQINIRYIELTEHTSEQEVDLFIIGLFGYRSIDFAKNPRDGFRNLIFELNSENFILGGGILFFCNQTKIFPSCCCGLESWKEIFFSISKKESPWMGHDPYPVIEYVSKKAVIWSDDCLGIYGNKKPKSNLVSVEYLRDDLENMAADIEKDLSDFIKKPFYLRANELNKEHSYELAECLLSALL